jgi:hypothetical protein
MEACNVVITVERGVPGVQIAVSDVLAARRGRPPCHVAGVTRGNR